MIHHRSQLQLHIPSPTVDGVMRLWITLTDRFSKPFKAGGNTKTASLFQGILLPDKQDSLREEMHVEVFVPVLLLCKQLQSCASRLLRVRMQNRIVYRLRSSPNRISCLQLLGCPRLKPGPAVMELHGRQSLTKRMLIFQQFMERPDLSCCQRLQSFEF